MRRRDTENMPKLRNGSKVDSNPGSHDCESGIVSHNYRAPLYSSGAELVKLLSFSNQPGSKMKILTLKK